MHPRSMSQRLVPVVAFLLSAGPLAAQESNVPFETCAAAQSSGHLSTGHAERVYRLLEVTGAVPDRALGLRRPSDETALECAQAAEDPFVAGPLALGLVPARSGVWYNSAYADDRDNGFVWGGRGVSALLSAGVTLEAGILRAAFIPAVAWQQNASFDLRSNPRPGFPDYTNPYYTGIDLPQRMGTESFGSVDVAGQSYVRADAFGLTAGIAHENFVVGPAARNPIVVSSSASGFMHGFLGTTRPFDIWIARLEGQIVVGRLEESDHFDDIAENDRSGLALWTLSARPRGLPGLQVGVARAYMSRPANPDAPLDLDGLSRVLALGSESNLPGNELGSLFARWVMPAADAEIYVEWARDDRFAGAGEDFIPEPDHSQGWTVGFQKLTRTEHGALRLEAEFNHLQEKQEFRPGRDLPVFYVHHEVRQGWTHRGQLLGAGIGPGADAQFLALDWMHEWGYAGLFLERVRRNDGSRAAIDARRDWPYEHDTEIMLGLRGFTTWRERVVVSGSFAYGRRWYRDFIDSPNAVRLGLEVSAVPPLPARRP